MNRLFVAVDLPSPIKQRLTTLCGDLPGAMWLEPDQFHLTLRYIGAVDGGLFDDIRQALETVKSEPFEVTLEGIGFFPLRRTPESVWVGVQKNEPLLILQHRVDSVLRQCGLESEGRKYAPHVTLGRFGGGNVKNNKSDKLAAYLAQYSLFQAEPFIADSFSLYSGVRSHKGPLYRTEAQYPLTRIGVVTDEELS